MESCPGSRMDTRRSTELCWCLTLSIYTLTALGFGECSAFGKMKLTLNYHLHGWRSCEAWPSVIQTWCPSPLFQNHLQRFCIKALWETQQPTPKGKAFSFSFFKNTFGKETIPLFLCFSHLAKAAECFAFHSVPCSGSWKTAEKKRERKKEKKKRQWWQLHTDQGCTQAVLNSGPKSVFKASDPWRELAR